MCCRYHIRKISSLFWSAFNSVLISNAYNKNVSTSAWKDLHTYLISLKYFVFSTETSLCSKEWSNLTNPAVSFWFWCCFLFFYQKPKTFELVNLLNWDSIAKQKMCIFFYVFFFRKGVSANWTHFGDSNGPLVVQDMDNEHQLFIQSIVLGYVYWHTIH